MDGTWGDAREEYMRAEEFARRYGIEFVGSEYVAKEENEDDWVRLLDVIPVIAALEATLERFRPIVEERRRQDAKWGDQDHPDEWWYTILGEEYGEVAKAMLGVHFGYADVRKELVQTIAVGIAWLECMDRREDE